MLGFHHRLAFLNTVQNRFAKERYERDLKALAFNYGGLGALIAFVSAGALLVILAYHADPAENHYRDIAENFAQSLSSASLNANVSGEVSLAKGSTVSLANNQHVSLEAPSDSSVVDAPQTPRSTETNEMFQPSEKQLGLNQQSEKSQAPKTTYTIFETAPYRNGVVMTGWEYEPENTQTPSAQYCYFSGTEHGKGVFISIARNRAPLVVKDQNLIDPAEAFSLCHWR